ncbi:MAG: hypothetical protein Q9224_007688, partial [Gallowayella concinna]
KPAEHFKDVVEWLVHNKINPAFKRDDPIYTNAVYKLDDKVQAYAESMFTSSAWKPEFSHALKSLPECARVDVGTMGDRKCEACGRSGHPAKHQLTFSGKPYHRDSLEDVTSSEDEDDSAEDERDSETKYTKAFFLGRTCNANAETAHTLRHWRHALKQDVIAHLRNKGYLAPAKIVERTNWNTKKRERYANEIVDGMEESGEMGTLYKLFKDTLEAARSAKNEVG